MMHHGDKMYQMSNFHFALIFASSILAGLANAVAGGGTFFSFPALTAGGLSSLVANATNAVAVTPGHLLAAVTYREILGRSKTRLIILGVASAFGAIAGAYLLTITSAATFAKLVPWLLLFATVSFAGGPYLQKALSAKKAPGKTTEQAQDPANEKASGVGIKSSISYFLASIYGGDFGAGQGIVLMNIP